MAILATVVSIVLLSLFGATYGDSGGWQSAYATFYGGSDASGTMGQFFSKFKLYITN